MVGITSTVFKETVEELIQLIKATTTNKEKDKLQVLYWLKQEKAPAIQAIAKSLGHHRNTVQTWGNGYSKPFGFMGQSSQQQGKVSFVNSLMSIKIVIKNI